MTGAQRTSYLGLDYDPIELGALVETLRDRPADAPFAYLVTPNVDHVVRLHEHSADSERMWAAYRRATWCICDSRILAALAWRRGIMMTVTPGSDLVVRLLDDIEERGGMRIAVIGGNAETIARLAARYPSLDVIHHSPPMGLRHDIDAIDAAARFFVAAKAPFVFLAVGSPQQELVAARITELGEAAGIGLCTGAAIEFAAGTRARAPRIVQRFHLEWAYRLASNPLRLWRRYLITGPRIFRLARNWSRS